jgi:L-malate glycosyltransferase
MKILHLVEYYYPSIGGAQEVVRHLSERMVAQGHDVTVATTKLPHRKNLVHNGVKIVEFDIKSIAEHGVSIVGGLKGDIEGYQKFLVNGDFDVVMSYAAQQWTTDLMFGVIDKIKAKKVLVPCGYSGLYDPAYRTYFYLLPDILHKFDATVYLSDTYRDIDFARRHGLKNIHVIPNGADENEFRNLLTQEEKIRIRNQYGIGGFTIMTIANYTGEKGHTELLKFFKRLPVANATLVSAGNYTPGIGCFDMFEQQANRVNNHKKFLGKRVVMLDGSDHLQVHKVLMAADLFVFLSNIEASPLVLFESAAAGVPFLATNVGNSKEIAEWTGAGKIVKTRPRPNGRVAADIKDAIIQATKLIHSKKELARLGKVGRANWESRYTWDALTNEYLKLYESLVKRKARK